MESSQFGFALISSLALATLGVALALPGLADWGLAMVGMILLAITLGAWWQQRSDDALQVLSLSRSSTSGAAPQ